MGDELILVTGASGYVATHTIQQLQKAGHKVSTEETLDIFGNRSLCLQNINIHIG